ncbi:MAG TPA: hypothetical protein VMU89_09270 [Thermomicrobiaceae bacterium]|nr:hypothetical protein [Thermomicrobiaceae bacterium]
MKLPPFLHFLLYGLEPRVPPIPPPDAPTAETQAVRARLDAITDDVAAIRAELRVHIAAGHAPKGGPR